MNTTTVTDIEPGTVDVHHHILPPFYLETLQKAGVETSGFPDWTPHRSLQLLDQLGIRRALLSVSSPGVWFGNAEEARALARSCNEFVATLAETHPERLGGLAILPFPDVEGALAEVAYALDGLGMDGVILFSNVQGHYVGDPEFDALLAELDRRESLVLLHPGHLPVEDENAPLHRWAEYPIDIARAYTRLVYRDAFLLYPGIRWILAHAGGVVPFMAERLGKAHYAKEGGLRWWRIIKDMTLKRNGGLELAKGVGYDTAGSANSVTLAGLRRLVGPEDLHFGSNFPWDGEEVVEGSLRFLEGEGAWSRPTDLNAPGPGLDLEAVS